MNAFEVPDLLKLLILELQVFTRCSSQESQYPAADLLHWLFGKFSCETVTLAEGLGVGGVTVTHPLHAIAVADLQLLLGPLEAAVLLVIGWGLEVDVDVVGGLGSRRHGCKAKHTN